MTIWFDLPAEVAPSAWPRPVFPTVRAQPGEFFAAVAAGYARRADAAPQRFARIDANASRHAVWQQVAQVLQAQGWLQPVLAWWA
jgi:dTMP kinase